MNVAISGRKSRGRVVAKGVRNDAFGIVSDWLFTDRVFLSDESRKIISISMKIAMPVLGVWLFFFIMNSVAEGDYRQNVENVPVLEVQIEIE